MGSLCWDISDPMSPATVGISNGVRDELRAWLRQGMTLRAKLVTERDGLVARLREIDAALAAIPKAAPEHATGVMGTTAPALPIQQPGKPITARAVVLKVLELHLESPMTTGEITREAQVFRPIGAKLVAHALHRMVRTGEIQAHGTHGKGTRLRYSLPKSVPMAVRM